ncbi:MAG TPA: phage holin family protein [Candidatus Angelobacter sp.]|nr:phage holin family protein [Candidatus Angelobacter sp.]
MKLLVKWLINAVTFLIVSRLVPGFYVNSFGAALLAALVFGFINSTLGLLLKILTFPLTILTLGFFLIVVNAIMLKMAASVTPGFHVRTWTAALVGAICLTVISTVLQWLLKDSKRDR